MTEQLALPMRTTLAPLPPCPPFDGALRLGSHSTVALGDPVRGGCGAGDACIHDGGGWVRCVFCRARWRVVSVGRHHRDSAERSHVNGRAAREEAP